MNDEQLQIEFRDGWEAYMDELIARELGPDYFIWLESLDHQEEPCSVE